VAPRFVERKPAGVGRESLCEKKPISLLIKEKNQIYFAFETFSQEVESERNVLFSKGARRAMKQLFSQPLAVY
jgi:hypothetical protein